MNEWDIKISKFLREQNLSDNYVLYRLWGPIFISHQGKLEASWVAHSGDGDVELTMGERLRPHPQTHITLC